jgi:DNA-binding NarL/FixJ family response regulator
MKKGTDEVIEFPDSGSGASAERAIECAGGSPSRVLLLGDVLFHREALALALRGYDGIALVASVADVHVALTLAEERRVNVLLVDSPSDGVARALAACSLPYKVVFIGALGEVSRQLASRGVAIFVGASSSLDEVHVALRSGRPAPVEPRPPGWGELSVEGGDAVLSQRELQICRLVAGGHSNKEIASACGISIATVKNHVHRILRKLNVQRRAQIAPLAGDQRTHAREPTR